MRLPARGSPPRAHTVHILARDYDRAIRAIGRIESRLPVSGGTIKLELCDLSDLSEVRRFAEGFQARFDRLDLLVNNAGVLPEARTHTPDGVELTFATNVLGPFLLTSLLLPALLAAAPARVITVSSGGMYTARLRPEDLQLENEPFDGARFYAHTKRAQVALNRTWAERFPADHIAFHAMHPGWVDTPGLRTSLPRFRRVMRPLLRDARQGADTAVWLGESSGSRAGNRRLLAGPRAAARAPHPFDPRDPTRTENGSGGSASASAPPRSPRERQRSADHREKGTRDGEIHRNDRSTTRRGGGVALPGGPSLGRGVGSQRRRGGADRRRAAHRGRPLPGRREVPRPEHRPCRTASSRSIRRTEWFSRPRPTPSWSATRRGSIRVGRPPAA